jgi:hypothetical protein
MVRRMLLILLTFGMLGLAGCHAYYAGPYSSPYYYGYNYYYYEPGGYYYRDYRIVRPDGDDDDKARPPRDQITPDRSPRDTSPDGSARSPRGGGSDGPWRGGGSSGGRAPRSG